MLCISHCGLSVIAFLNNSWFLSGLPMQFLMSACILVVVLSAMEMAFLIRLALLIWTSVAPVFPSWWPWKERALSTHSTDGCPSSMSQKSVSIVFCICLLSNVSKVWCSLGVVSLPSVLPHLYFHTLPRSPHHNIKVMSVGSLQEKADSAIVWRGPRKTALIKRFVKDTFWGRLDYLIFDILPICLILGLPPVSIISRPSPN